ncbi:MAG: FAD-linked oxidase C-terminal domain-containing protein [Aeromicrobium sp.]|uniref:FAD-binding oxidoreductase n=1 Tax=Aeromicrobium sp. TaxID=1871063 RepID=UPI0039E29932
MLKGTEFLAELEGALSAGALVTEPSIMESYRRDWSGNPAVGMPLAVVRAKNTGDVQETLAWATRHRVPVVPRGAGSGLSGGATAVDGGIVLSTEKMRSVRIDPVTRVAVVQPGALNIDVKNAALEHGLWYPPDPASYEICSIGGNVATNAGGLCCVKYGVTTDYVLGVEVVLADGRVLSLGGPRLKDAAGLSLTKLLVGSGGVLGVFTEITLRLIPALPPSSTMVAVFSSVESAAEAVLGITSALRPSILELMDHGSINAVEDFMPMGLDRSAEAILLARSDAPGAAAADEISRMEEIVRGFGATEVFTTSDQAEGDQLAAARRAVLPALHDKGAVLVEDIGVAVHLLPTLIHRIGEIARQHDVLIPVVAHAGDGNVHPQIVFDPEDAAMRDRADEAFAAIMDLALELGGTITGEHGIGRVKKAWLPQYVGDDAMEIARRIKDVFDPDNLLNPGALF